MKQKTHPKNPESRNHTKDPPFAYLGVFHLDFFGTMFRKFSYCTKSPPFNFATERMLKKPKGSPFYIFGTVTLFKILNFCFFFQKFFNVAKASQFHFFRFYPKLEFQKV